ncbi:hypothetical protein GCM10009555_107260 [Acrocarpospora macrocephala]|uniref:Uncharacterized protein n=1 Tax=Acrocarpospora macrocephala TaxID=150177 RepID=A0A5M3XAD7_9ACTN|nr:hypothetical protein [Acrocarpospora macrocephala]GES15038.1 hypothetical protein Amac_086350 [Acrocarpospora macrocephala]
MTTYRDAVASVRNLEELVEVEETLGRVIGGSALAKLRPPRDLAYAAITFYLGVDLLTHLDADRSRTEALFSLAAQVAPRARPLALRGRDA